MKKLFALSAIVFCLSGTDLQAQHATINSDAAAKTEMKTATRKEAKMYRQPGTSSEVIRTLGASEEVVLVRKLNSSWSIIKVGDEVGYIQNSKIKNIVK